MFRGRDGINGSHWEQEVSSFATGLLSVKETTLSECGQ